MFIDKYIYVHVLSKISLQFVKTELAATAVGEKFTERIGGYVPMEMVIKGSLFNAVSPTFFHGRTKLPFYEKDQQGLLYQILW